MEHEPTLQFEPIADDETGRFVQGVDRTDFRSLGSRLIPCSQFHSAHAVDLAWRVWWWDAKTPRQAGSEYPGTNYWLLVDDENAAKVLREMEQWRRVAPLALQPLREFLSEESIDKRVSLWQRIMDMQDALLAAWDVPPGVARCWRLNYLYRTITLDGRWLLTEYEIPPFDVALFAQLLPRPATDTSRDMLRDFLMNDPFASRMPDLFQHIININAPAEAIVRGLRVINGGLDA